MLNHNDVIIPQPSLRFVHAPSGEVRGDIWPELGNGYWEYAIPYNFERNVLLGSLHKEFWHPVLPEFYPLELDSLWNSDRKNLVSPPFLPKLRDVNCKEFLSVVECFIDRFSGKKIGVQLSGGLDSSIIIGLLRHLNVPFSLVGLYSDRYEFRTENYIQNLLSEGAVDFRLINYEEHLPMSSIQNVPLHQYPDLSCCNFAAESAIAASSVEMGVEVIFSGFGGDLVFADDFSSGKVPFSLNAFSNSWVNDLIYRHAGVHLVPFYGDFQIAESLFNLRRGRGEDPNKLWARSYFRSVLPSQLSDFSYKADFWGLYIDGLVKEIPSIRNAHESAFDSTRHPYFSASNLESLLESDLFNCDKELYQRIEARASLAVWYNSLVNYSSKN